MFDTILTVKRSKIESFENDDNNDEPVNDNEDLHDDNDANVDVDSNAINDNHQINNQLPTTIDPVTSIEFVSIPAQTTSNIAASTPVTKHVVDTSPTMRAYSLDELLNESTPPTDSQPQAVSLEDLHLLTPLNTSSSSQQQQLYVLILF